MKFPSSPIEALFTGAAFIGCMLLICLLPVAVHSQRKYDPRGIPGLMRVMVGLAAALGLLGVFGLTMNWLLFALAGAVIVLVVIVPNYRSRANARVDVTREVDPDTDQN
ncbi:MAG: hypothetical protein H7287_07125 [Thermoleophilia bacterium]|nr:hypothetical protein [Thermoleophilia bacterium]